MKRTIIFILCMISSMVTFGQNQKTLDEITCTPPKFMGIKGTFQQYVEHKIPTIESYIGEHISYPNEALAFMDQGTVVVRFTITPAGDLSNIKIINSVSNEIDEEVIKTLTTTNGMWKPGYTNEKAVAMEKELSVVFKLEGWQNTDFNYLAKKHFSKGAEMLLAKQKPRIALKYFNKGVVLFPNETAMLALRGMARYETGDKDGALNDWNRVRSLGGFEADVYLNNLSDFNGYAEMMSVIKGK